MSPAIGLDCSAIVGTLDRATELEACLASLQAADPPFREVIVADQSAGEALRPMVEKHGARYLHLERRGLSAARNRGLEVATAAWVAFPDDDCTLAPDALSEAARALERDPAAAFLCGRIETPAGAPTMIGMTPRERALTTAEDVLRTVMSPGLMVERRALSRVGPFDERFGVGARFPSGEESDLLFRLLAAGQRGIYAPGIKITHPDPFAVRDPEAQNRRAFEYGRGWGALFAKHADTVARDTFKGLQRRYVLRAFGGLARATLLGKRELASRYAASWRGRRQGWREYRAEARP